MASTSQSRLFLNLALLLLVAGLGGFVWWKTNQTPQRPDSLLTQTRADITRVTITRSPSGDNPDVIHLQRTGEQWNMLKPKQMQANATRITQLFTLLDETVDASYDATGKDLVQYGLKPAAVSVAFNDETLLFGEENPVSHKRYILSGGKIKLASEAVYGLLTGDPLELASSKLIPEGSSIKEVILPEGFASKPETLQNWQFADAVRLEALDGKPEGQQVTLMLDNGGKVTLVLLPDEADLVLANEALGVRYILPEPQRANLFPPVQ